MSRAAPRAAGTSPFPWRSIAGWVVALVVVYLLVRLAGDLSGRIRPRSFAILYPQNGALVALLGLLGIVAVLAVTSLVGKWWGERGRKGRRIAYSAVLGDQLTHLFFWIVIIFALYPIFFVVAASFDPRNTLASGSLGAITDPLLVRARVLPSLEGKDFSNYAKLFEDVVMYAWQWVILAVAGLGVLGLGGVWVATQTTAGGVPTPALRRARVNFTWLALIAVAIFLAALSPAQFTGYSSASRFILWIRNTFLISGLTGLLTVALTTTAGYALARLRFPGRYQTLLFLIFIQMFPALLSLVALFALISGLGLLNTFTGLILAYSGGAISFGTWIYKGYVESLPASLEEAALVDGCTRWTAFTRIVLPLSGPMLVFIFLLQFVGTYAEFLLANVLLTGVQNWNVGVGLRSFQQGTVGSTQYGVFAAAAVLGSLPIVALYYSFQQVFVSGTLAGGVKE